MHVEAKPRTGGRERRCRTGSAPDGNGGLGGRCCRNEQRQGYGETFHIPVMMFLKINFSSSVMKSTEMGTMNVLSASLEGISL